jgi:hypothetical protein
VEYMTRCKRCDKHQEILAPLREAHGLQVFHYPKTPDRSRILSKF